MLVIKVSRTDVAIVLSLVPCCDQRTRLVRETETLRSSVLFAASRTKSTPQHTERDLASWQVHYPLVCVFWHRFCAVFRIAYHSCLFKMCDLVFALIWLIARTVYTS